MIILSDIDKRRNFQKSNEDKNEAYADDKQNFFRNLDIVYAKPVY